MRFSVERLAARLGLGRDSLRTRALRGAVWTLGGYGASQVLRLGSNLILTRLLFPEAFGLMSLVQVFIIGLHMFSDIGITPAIIHSKRGDDPRFLNTAWSIAVLRGALLWVLACILAYPISRFYHEPMLWKVMPAVGFTAFLSGFNSTKLATANRELALKRLTLMTLGTSATSIVVMIVLAYFWRSVWALVVGGIVGSALEALLGHLLLPGPWNRFGFDRTAVKELHRFGRWVFVSTALGFVYSQSDRMVLAKVFDVGFLGIYTVAMTFSQLATQVMSQLGSRVLFPSYAELQRTRPEAVYAALRKARIVLLSIGLTTMLVFVLGGPWLIRHMYDQRYIGAGEILQILALGTMVNSLGTTYGDVLMARGKTALMAMLIAVNIVFQLAGMLVGSRFGSRGVVVGLALASLAMYPVIALTYRRLRVWQPELDLPVLAIVSGGTLYLLLG